MQYRATHIEVDLSKIEQNVRLLKQTMGGAKLMAVVKANAYGHGLVQVAKTALSAGADWLAVAIPEEGENLRKNGVKAPILVLGGVNSMGARASVENGLTQVVFDPRGLMELEQACAALGRHATAHIKLDTGMGRIGVRSELELRALLRAFKAAPGVELTGVFTHFANADAENDEYTAAQMAKFRALCAVLPSDILHHAASSAAMLRYPETRLDMVRAGIVMYGYPPVKTQFLFQPALQWKTEIAYIKEIEAGACVSYGCTYRADKPTRVATLPVGYGDGYHRALSGKGFVLVGGKRCPILGRVCMDQMMVDVTAVPAAKRGDTVVLLGRQGSGVISAEDLAGWAGTISYEMLLSATERVPVSYIKQP